MNRLFLLLFFVLSFGGVYAQMSDEQVVTLLKSAYSQGMSEQEIGMLLVQKGVTQDQLMRIKNRSGEQGNVLENSSVESRMRTVAGEDMLSGKQKRNKNNDQNILKDHTGANRQGNLLDSVGQAMGQNERNVPRQADVENQVFGRSIFENKALTFEPNLNVATSENYILGPGDEIIIDVWGDSERTIRQQISPDGNIWIETLGPVFLSGLKVSEAAAHLKKELTRIYASIDNNTTFIKLSLGKIRSIKVNMMGEISVPGTYTLPSLATLFHALYSAGGVNGIGSLRSIKISREGKEIADIDVYSYLLKGKNDLDIGLKDGDVIIVSPYQNLVSLKGKVKRPMKYELTDIETLGDLLDYAGGFMGEAYKAAVRVIRKSGKEHQVFNIEKSDYSSFVLTDGDEITVDAVIPRFENKIEVRGAVYREGLYALDVNMSSVKQLIEKAEGLREDAFLNRAVLYRNKPDLTLETQAVDVAGIMNGSVPDIPLRKNDVLYIPSIFDLREEYTITIRGAIGYPGVYKFAENMTVEDLVIQAGGLKESASVVKIDIARRVKNPKSLEVGNLSAESFTVTLQDGLALTDNGERFVLQPFDEVFIHNSPGYQVQQNVEITGEVLFAGTYAIAQKGERVSDLIGKAGGITPDSYIDGARLMRKKDPDEIAREEAMQRLLKQTGKDSIDASRVEVQDYYTVGIDLKNILKNKGSEYDIVLREGDHLHIPQYTGTVKISGAVMYPNTVAFNKKARLRDYIDQGGGFAARAKKHKVFIVYMNGTVAKSKLLSKAKAAPGCEIIVPLKPTRKGMGIAEIMGLATSTTSMAALVTSIINSSK